MLSCTRVAALYQAETIRFMYSMVAAALSARYGPAAASAGHGYHQPRDYLGFFCLGNRETMCVWCGVVWCSVVWCSVFGVVWCDVVLVRLRCWLAAFTDVPARE